MKENDDVKWLMIILILMIMNNDNEMNMKIIKWM